MISVLLLVFLIPLSITQDITFPGKSRRQPNHEMVKTRVREDCSINMTMIQEGGESICECVFGYLYYPPLDNCFKPYTRGPCSAGKYFTLPPGKTTAECSQNPCEEGSIMYQNSCHKLLTSGPPCKSHESLVVSEENYEIICQEVFPVLYQIIVAPIRHCSPGSRMIAHGKCRRSL